MPIEHAAVFFYFTLKIEAMDHGIVFIFARALHIAAVVLWIGGVAFVTTVLIAALKRLPDENQRMQLFEQLEGRFAFQARITTLVTGFSGFYMLWFMDAWQRYLTIQHWWLHAMTAIWLVFTLVLFVLEPLFLHRWFRQQASVNSERTFSIMHRLHSILLILSLLTVLGAALGSHGYLFF